VMPSPCCDPGFFPFSPERIALFWLDKALLVSCIAASRAKKCRNWNLD
jgi:hypothetical protein